LFVILVVAVPAAVVGVRLGMSTGDPAGGEPGSAGLGATITDPVAVPAFTLPVLSPSIRAEPTGMPTHPQSPSASIQPATTTPAPAPPRHRKTLVLDNFDDSAVA
jgi:hypothetical protein